MRMFEFRCARCGHEFEELVGENEVPSCPRCGTREAERLLSACRCRRASASGDVDHPAPAGGGGGCAGCSGGHCASCH